MPPSAEFSFRSDEVAKQYQNYLVPRLFAPWAEALIAGVGIAPGAAVLDIATGPGTVARAAARRAGAGGRVTAVDASPSMLAVARAQPAEVGAASIEYRESLAAPLDVPSTAYDVVLCQQGLQFFPNQLDALREMKRALRPRGRLALSVWCRIEKCGMFGLFQEAFREAEEPTLAELITVPYLGPDGETLTALVGEAGFSAMQLLEETRSLRFEEGVGQVLRALSGTPLGPHLAALDAARQERVTSLVRRRLEGTIRNGAPEGPMTSWVVYATA